MPVPDLLTDFAAAVRADRAANPRIAGDGTGLELLIAPRFRTLVEAVLPELGIVPPSVLPEYTRAGVGRPDLAFARPGQPARSFIGLKEPGKALIPQQWRGHDADQFRRFGELPLWGLPAPDAIRTRLHALLATARAAEAMPWTPERTRVHRLMFHNMANWLPTGERDALRQDFAAELARLSTPA